ncbi:hypothetical protein PCASD_25615, partial [Puccinia coronata f. sp. avenae]
HSMEILFQFTSASSSCNNKTTGGGMGLSMHTPFRIATEKSRVAMPEQHSKSACLLYPQMPHTIGSPMPLTSLRRTRTGRGIPAGRWISRVLKRQATDHCFAQNTVEKIVEGLKAVQDGHLFSEDPSLKAWAGETLDLIQIRSPSSCIITLMALREGKKVSIDVCFAMDMRLAATCCDFTQFARPFDSNLALSMNRRNRLSDFASVVY